MLIRPLDDNGDIMPVLSSSDMHQDDMAVKRMIGYRLDLLAGDWWENETWGNEILDMLK